MLPEGWTGRSFERLAKKAGVTVYAAERFAVGSSPVPPAVRICSTAPQSVALLKKGLTILLCLLEHEDDFTLF